MERTVLSAASAHDVPLTATCLHCGQALAAGQQDFCCGGCEAAYGVRQAIQGGELEQWSGFAKPREDGSWELQVMVEGIHCASCIWNIESALRDQPGVIEARLNYTTQRLRLLWRGGAEQADALAARVTSLGYRLHPLAADIGEETERYLSYLLRCLAVSGFASGNLMLISVALWTTTAETMGMATRDLLHWISALIALPAVAYAARPFLSSAWSVLRQGRTNMDVPVSLAIVLASLMSLWETAKHGEYVYFDSAVMFTFFLLIGRYLDARARGRAKSAATQLLAMMQGAATVLENGQRRTVPLSELSRGMRVLVAAGEKIPADGHVVAGRSMLDASLITGETLPQPADVGARVFAGTINIDAPLEVEVLQASDETLLSQIVRLMEHAEQGQAQYVRLADRAARLYTPSVHSLAALTFLGWWLVMGAPWQLALIYASTVLIITCPCALGLAVPVVQVLASGLLMRRGILLKSSDALERLARIDTVVFDKTGTLTEGRPQLMSEEHGPDDLRLAASLAVHSRHPLSRALAVAYQGALIPLEVKELPGRGLEALHGGRTVRLGSRHFCGVQEDGGLALELWLADGDAAPVRFAFEDRLRVDAVEVVRALKEQGLQLHLLSGDRPQVVEAMAGVLGIDAYASGLSPVEKYARIEAMEAQGRRVLMVGDGLNDAAALTAASVSMSPSSALDIAQNAADIVFQGAYLKPVPLALAIARRSTRLVRQNLGMALFYNVFAVPVAVLGYVTPLIAAIAMSSSSLVVIFNAFRLNLSVKENAS